MPNLGEIQEIQCRIATKPHIKFKPFQAGDLLLLLQTETLTHILPGHPTLQTEEQPQDCLQAEVLRWCEYTDI